MDESLIPAITEYVKKFGTGAYNNEADCFLHYLWLENQRFRESMEGRDKRIIELLRENGDLRRKLGEKK